MAVLYFLAALLPIKSLWGFNFLSYLEWYYIPVFGILFIAALIPVTADRIFLFFSNFRQKLEGLPLFLRLLIIAVLSAGIFYLFRVHVHSLGDGYQRIYQVEQGYLYYHTEVFDFFLHGVLYAGLKMIGIASGETTYLIFSIAAGTCFVLALYLFKFSKDDFRESAIIKILILSFGGLQLFFGYAESYSLFYIFGLFYILYAVRFMLSGRGLLGASIMLALSGASHITSLVFVPSFVYLVYYNFRKVKPKTFNRKYLPIIIASVLIAAVIVQEVLLRVYVAEYVTSVSGGYLHLLPFSGYTIFSPQHLYDVLNELLVVAPAALMLLLAGIGVRSNGRKSLNIFLLICGLSVGLMLMVIDPKLGFPRDWDLFSIPAAVLGTVISIYFIKKLRFDSRPDRIKLLIGFFPIIFLAGWVLVNSSLKAELTRAEDLLTLSEKGRGYGYELLVYYYRFKAKDNEKVLELLNKINDQGRNARVYNKIAKTELDMGRQDDALKSIYKGLEIDSNFAELHLMAGTIWTNRGRPDYGLPHFLKALKLDPGRKETYHDIGTAYYKLDSLGMALRVYKDAIRLFPDDGLAYIEAGNMFRLLKQYDSAYYYVREGIQLNPRLAEGYQLLNVIQQEMTP